MNSFELNLIDSLKFHLEEPVNDDALIQELDDVIKERPSESQTFPMQFIVDIGPYLNTKLAKTLLEESARARDFETFVRVFPLVNDFYDLDWLYSWSIQNERVDIFHMLREKRLRWTYEERTRCFRNALEMGKMELIELISNPPRNDHYFTWAVRSKNMEVIRYLYNWSKDRARRKYCPHLFDMNAALDDAIFHNFYEALEFLLDKGADPNYGYEYPLSIAAKRGKLNFVKLLVEKGARVNAKQFEAFRWAAEHGQTEVVKFFLNNHDIDTSRYKNFAHRNAKKNGHWKICQLIEEYNAKKTING